MTTDTGKQYNVGVVGYGLSAKVFHIPFIQQTPGLALHSIVQRKPQPGDSAPDDHPGAKHLTSIEALVGDADVDLVVLSTPPATHFPFAKLALEHGKHVLVEKPFVPTSAQARELVALAAEKKLVLCVYQNRRWDADFTTVRKLLRDDTLGRVYEFETHFDRFRPEKPTTWKGKMTMDEGGGVLYDLGIHIIDQVYVLFGLPDSVFARFVNQREGRLVDGAQPDDEPDSISVTLSYPAKGLLVQVKAGVLSVEQQQFRFWVRGSQGSYYKTGLDPQEDQLRSGGKLTDAGYGKEDAVWDGKLTSLVNGMAVEQPLPNVEPETYLSLYRGLAKALATGKDEDVPVPASQAVEVLRIIEAVRASALKGQNVSI